MIGTRAFTAYCWTYNYTAENASELQES